MTTASSPDNYSGRIAVDPQGNKIGSIGKVYRNDQTGQPDWITINTGLFGMKESFAPLAGSRLSGDDLVLPFDKTVVKNSPEIADASHLDRDEQQSLHAYYEHHFGSGATAGGDRETTNNARQDTEYQQSAGHRRAGQTTDETMIRPQEPPRVGAEPDDDDRAGFREDVAADQQSVQAPVSREGDTDRLTTADTASPDSREQQLSRLDKLEQDIAAERDRLNTSEPQTRSRSGSQHTVHGQERTDSVREIDLPGLETKVTESQREAWSLGYHAGVSDAQSGGKATTNPFHPLRQP